MREDEVENGESEAVATPEPHSSGEADERRRVREEVVLAALIAGRNDSEAALIAGCSVRTVRRHREDPVFRRRLTDGRAARLDEQAGQFLELIDRARDTLVEGLTAEFETTRLRAADLLMKWATSLHKSTEVDVEIAELRAQLEHAIAAFESITSDGEELQ